MGNRLFFSDIEYKILKEFHKFPKRKDGFRDRYGRIIREDEPEIIQKLMRVGYLFQGSYNNFYNPDKKILKTASITPFGEFLFKIDRKKRINNFLNNYIDNIVERIKDFF